MEILNSKLGTSKPKVKIENEISKLNFKIENQNSNSKVKTKNEIARAYMCVLKYKHISDQRFFYLFSYRSVNDIQNIILN
ncbi:hypothetical protein EFT49_05600 [Leuconostoc falkenbergense]|nr:hypothetical protein [Leuconostoc falkenbergense]